MCGRRGRRFWKGKGERVSFWGQGEDGGCGLTWWRLCRRRDRRSGDMDCLVSWEGSISI